MNLLALEFSSAQRSAAVLEYDERGRSELRASITERNTRGMTGMVLVDEALRKAKVTVNEVNRMAVGLGPGSYTGIRSAIAIGEGWELARQIELVGVSSVEVLASEAKKHRLKGEISLVIDAQRNELYVARYNLESSPPTVLEELQLVAKSAMGAGQKAGPESTKFFRETVDLFPTAVTVGELAACIPSGVSGNLLEPIYLREISFVKVPAARVVK